MGSRLRVAIGALALIGASLLLAACSDDAGVDQHGQKVAAEHLEGQWLIINYWAEWCVPCRTEIPELNAFAEAQRDKGVKVLGVNFDGLQGDELNQAARKMGIGFTVLAEDPAKRYELPRNEALPVTYIIDAQGKVRERLLGEQSAAGLTAKLDELRKGG